ncbi:hypothetical protein XENTR_v10005577 [Xenopus tropicalis]|nr:hypothetical protein XENTR_v10005577 [Xenopus tropicalis]
MPLRHPHQKKNKAWKDIAEHVNSVGVCVRNVHQCKKRYQDIKRCLKKKLAEKSRYRSGTGGGPAKRVHYTRYEELLRTYIHRESVRGVSGMFDTDWNVCQDSSPPGPSRRRPMASAPVPGGCSLSGLPSPHSNPEIEGEGFSGEASERGSHVGGSGVAFSSDEEPDNIQQQQQLPTQAPTQPTRENVAPREQAQSRFHKSLNRHHKAHMRKMDQQHVDSCVATNAYNAGQARQAAHESAMLALQQELVTSGKT